MMAVNPSIEVYLLDSQGEILSYVVLDKNVKLNRIEIEPVIAFIESRGNNYILGDDPRKPGEQTIFSATAVEENGQLMGYVYIVLVSEESDNITTTLLTSYWLKVGTRSFILTLIAAFAIGLLLIWIVSRNMIIIVNTFKSFEQGNLNARIPEKKMKGELGVLSRTFNNMADTILRNIDELKQVDSLRRELIANVSHDLRNPLAIVHGYIETLIIKDESLSAKERKRYLKIILEGSEKLKRLVADLFELSRLEAGQIRIKKEPFLINELMQDTVHHYQLIMEEKKLELDAEIATSVPMVYADISLFERVIQNLMSNAIQYTPEMGSVKVKVKKVQDKVEVEVRNSGKGIPEEDLPHIFDRYYKVSKEKSGIEGTGLGLAIVKKILDIHNINIAVSSIPDKYTSFSFSVPAMS